MVVVYRSQGCFPDTLSRQNYINKVSITIYSCQSTGVCEKPDSVSANDSVLVSLDSAGAGDSVQSLIGVCWRCTSGY